MTGSTKRRPTPSPERPAAAMSVSASTAMSAAPVSTTHAPPAVDGKRQKYDRQLRLWKSHGQTALETAHVCLLYGTATGCELLKNLILPGIGQFTVVDDRTATADDVESNFFLDVDAVGGSRGACCVKLLQELNEDVRGRHVEENPAKLIDDSPNFFSQFNVIVATGEVGAEHQLLVLDRICREYGVCLVVVSANGFVGMTWYDMLAANVPRIHHMPVIETHPGNVVDLRLDCPWPELHEAATALDLSSMDSHQLTHVPYVLLLLNTLQEWRKKHPDQTTPRTTAERTAFKQLLLHHAPTPDEENFAEASAAVFRLAQTTGVPARIRALLDDPAVERSIAPFWVMVRALRGFVEGQGGVLPVPGNVPDMKADTESYVALQGIYKRKAQQDVAAIRNLVNADLTARALPLSTVSDEDVETFCKNCAYLRVVRHRGLVDEFGSERRDDVVARLLADDGPDGVNIQWYIAMRAAQRFINIHGRYPGQCAADDTATMAADVEALREIAKLLVPSGTSVSEDYLREITRYGGSELHATAAMVGGIGAQECLKILMRQYVPVDGTVVLNGSASTTSVFCL